MSANIFKDGDFKSWLCRMNSAQNRVTCVVELADGRIEVCGNTQWGIDTLQKRLKSNRRASLEWVPPVGNLNMLEKPLGEIHMKTVLMRKYAAATLRHFIGQKTLFGTGECMLWEHRVEVDKLKYSKVAVKKVWNSPIIMIEDVINWEKFTVKSFGVRVEEKHFNIIINWREMCVLIIEVAYDALGLDVDSLHHVGEVDHLSGPGPDIASGGQADGVSEQPYEVSEQEARVSEQADGGSHGLRGVEPLQGCGVEQLVSGGNEGGLEAIQLQHLAPVSHLHAVGEQHPSQTFTGHNDTSWMCHLFEDINDRQGHQVTRHVGPHQTGDSSGSEHEGDLWVNGVACGEENLSGRVDNVAEKEENVAKKVGNSNESEDNINALENLRDVMADKQNKILVGSLSNYIGEGTGQNLVVQIIEIMSVEGVISLIISDGNNWLKCSLDEKYYRRVESGELKQFDIIKNVVLTGDVHSEIAIRELCRPKSIQMKVPKLIGSPVPCKKVEAGKQRNKRKVGNKRGPMPRVDELFEDSLLSRYYFR